MPHQVQQVGFLLALEACHSNLLSVECFLLCCLNLEQPVTSCICYFFLFLFIPDNPWQFKQRCKHLSKHHNFLFTPKGVGHIIYFEQLDMFKTADKAITGIKCLHFIQFLVNSGQGIMSLRHFQVFLLIAMVIISINKIISDYNEKCWKVLSLKMACLFLIISEHYSRANTLNSEIRLLSIHILGKF